MATFLSTPAIRMFFLLRFVITPPPPSFPFFKSGERTFLSSANMSSNHTHIVGFRDVCERARCTARTCPFKKDKLSFLLGTHLIFILP